MKVLLKRTFVTVLGRFKKSEPKSRPTEVPEVYRDHLPSDAVIVGEDHVEEEGPNEPDTLSEMLAVTNPAIAAAISSASTGEALEAKRLAADAAETAEVERLTKATAALEEAMTPSKEPKVLSSESKRGPGRPRKVK